MSLAVLAVSIPLDDNKNAPKDEHSQHKRNAVDVANSAYAYAEKEASDKKKHLSKRDTEHKTDTKDEPKDRHVRSEQADEKEPKPDEQRKTRDTTTKQKEQQKKSATDDAPKDQNPHIQLTKREIEKEDPKKHDDDDTKHKLQTRATDDKKTKTPEKKSKREAKDTNPDPKDAKKPVPLTQPQQKSGSSNTKSKP